MDQSQIAANETAVDKLLHNNVSVGATAGGIGPAEVAALYVRHADELRRFLAGVLRDGILAEDVLQITFAKAVEQTAKGLSAAPGSCIEGERRGSDAAAEVRDRPAAAIQGSSAGGFQSTTSESLKAWLFQVAYREALTIRRRDAVHAKATQKIQESESTHGGQQLLGQGAAGSHHDNPASQLVRLEEIGRVQAAVEELSSEQRQVVRMRMHDGRKFAEIAAELGIPLGTVLSRMQSALKHLRRKLQD